MAKRLPEDIKQISLWLAKGYDRRRAKIEMERGSRKGARRRAKEEKRLAAVTDALDAIGADIPSEVLRKQLREAIMRNIQSGRKYPYERLAIDFVSRTEFYRRKDKFLADIASRMDL